MHVLGSSGSGKSRFLEWMIRGDLRNRQGFCLIDPHGELYDATAAYCARHVLDRDLILLNLWTLRPWLALILLSAHPAATCPCRLSGASRPPCTPGE